MSTTKNIIISLLALSLTGLASAQQVHQGESFTLSGTLPPAQSHEYTASRHIDLNPGFHSEPSGSNTAVLQIDAEGFGVYPPEEGYTDSYGNVVGALGGTVDIGVMGAAVYTIPLELPDGINGMKPRLAVTYNSQAGNGLLGWGWFLDGMSSVTRTGKTLYHDGVMSAPNLTWSDPLLLDGQRLIPVAQYSDSTEYRTEQDGMSKVMAYSRYLFPGNLLRVIDSLKVWRADGTIMRYGATADSWIECQSGLAMPICWLLSSVTDRSGNAVLYHYHEDTPKGEFYVDSITYTANARMQTPPQFTVSFGYSGKREDYEKRYIGGSQTLMKHLLLDITVTKAEDRKILRKYEFTYNPFTFNRLYHTLAEITMLTYNEDGNEESIKPTTVVWEGSVPNQLVQYTVFTPGFLDDFPFAGDFDGDGYTDLAMVPYKDGDTYAGPVDVRVYLNDRNQGFTHAASLDLTGVSASLDWIHVLDIDGDGVDDLVLRCYDTVPSSGTESTTVTVYRNNPATASFTSAGSCFVSNKADILTGDYDGDGVTDALLLEKTLRPFPPDNKSGTNPLMPHLENAFLLGYTGALFHNRQLNAASLKDLGPVFNEVPADYDGDGVTEILMVSVFQGGASPNSSWIGKVDPGDSADCLKTLDRLDDALYPFHSFGATHPWCHVFPGDFNGDGKADLLYYLPFSYQWYLCLSKGNTMGNPVYAEEPTLPHLQHSLNIYYPSLSLVENAQVGSYLSTVIVADFDGDGCADVAYTLQTESRMYFLSRMYIESQVSNSVSFLRKFYSGMSLSSQFVTTGNFLGSDNPSILRSANPSRDRPAGPVGFYAIRPVSQYNSVVSVTDGLGNSTSFTYDCLMPDSANTIEPFYTFSHAAPDADGVRPVPLPVRALRTCTVEGVNGSRTITVYRYSNAMHHRDGHGFLGFTTSMAETRRNSESSPWLARKVSLNETSTMGRYAMMLPLREVSYVNHGGEARTVDSTEYTFENAVFSSALTDLVVCPAMTGKVVETFSMDREHEPLSTVTTYYYYNYSGNQGGGYTYDNAYGCDFTERIVAGYDNGTPVCELMELKQTDLQTLPGSWIINRPLSETARSTRGNEWVDSKAQYTYTSGDSYLPATVTLIPNDGTQADDPLTLSTQYTHDGYGNVTGVTVSAPNGIHGETPRVTAYEYGGAFQHRLLTKETRTGPAGGYTTDYGYDFHDRLCSVTDPNRKRTATVTSVLGTDRSVFPHDGTEQRSLTLWAGQSPYKPAGASYYTWEKRTGGVTSMTFRHKTGAVLRRVTFDFHGNPVFTDFRYNSDGLLERESVPYRMGDPEEDIRWTVYTYDSHDRVTRADRPDGSAERYSYDGLETTVSVTPPDSFTGAEPQSVVKRTNAMGWTVESVDADGTSVFYEYYPDGNLKWARVGGDTSTAVIMEYDHARNRTLLHDPDYCMAQRDLVSVYNAFGEEIQRTTPRQLSSTYVYDCLGRMASRTEQNPGNSSSVTTTWQYGETSPNKGLLLSVAHPGQTVTYTYDTCQRIASETVQFAAGGPHVTRYTYDRASRTSSVTHPSGFKVVQLYNHTGYPSVQTDSLGRELYRTNDATPEGQTERFTLGGALTNTLQYDPDRRLLTGILSKKGAATLQNFLYGYDGFCNLASRKDNMRNLEETFRYDDLNRLTEVRLGTVCTGASAYDSYGRMTAKTAGGQAVFFGAVYNAAGKPHAMAKAAASSSAFPEANQAVDYTGFDKVCSIKQGRDSLRCTYGYDHRRIAMTEYTGDTVRSKRYVGACEQVTVIGGYTASSHWLTHLAGPTGVYAVVEKRGGEETLHYILKDNLGSWTTVTDSEGNVEQRLSYDAWGSLRDPDTWSGSFTGKPMFDRGFTGHEHLTAFGLINMNGRMYDPVMSSFLSVDRYVQHPESAQGFNRYAYCGHNPLRYVDPSGWEMVKPAPGMTPSSADYAMDPYAYAERAYEPRDLGLLQLPTDDPTVVWMEGNERHGVGKNGDLSVSTPSDLSENPPEGVEVHTGNCLLLKAFWHYQFGGGKDYWVDASTLDLYYISQDDLKYLDDGTATINLFEYSKTDNTALALGKISLEPIGDNLFEIKPDKYDFNIEWDQGWTKRNVATAIAGYLHGPVFDNVPVPTHWMDGRPCYAQPSVYFGGSFSFHFSNSVYIKP